MTHVHHYGAGYSPLPTDLNTGQNTMAGQMMGNLPMYAALLAFRGVGNGGGAAQQAATGLAATVAQTAPRSLGTYVPLMGSSLAKWGGVGLGAYVTYNAYQGAREHGFSLMNTIQGALGGAGAAWAATGYQLTPVGAIAAIAGAVIGGGATLVGAFLHGQEESNKDTRRSEILQKDANGKSLLSSVQDLQDQADKANDKVWRAQNPTLAAYTPEGSSVDLTGDRQPDLPSEADLSNMSLDELDTTKKMLLGRQHDLTSEIADTNKTLASLGTSSSGGSASGEISHNSSMESMLQDIIQTANSATATLMRSV